LIPVLKIVVWSIWLLFLEQCESWNIFW
jgi:hypothetical protein